MMYQNYQEKIKDIDHQNAVVAARREENRTRMGVQANYLATIKEKAAKATRDK